MSGAIETPLTRSLCELHLPAFRENFQGQALLAEKEGSSFTQYLLVLCELEVEERRQRRIRRKRAQSKLPHAKTLSAFDRSRLPRGVDRQFSSLLVGDFLDRRENVLLFGQPGSGKTHLMCALGHELVLRDRAVYFTSCASISSTVATLHSPGTSTYSPSENFSLLRCLAKNSKNRLETKSRFS